MIKKIGFAAGVGALLLAVGTPALAFTMPSLSGLNGSINYGQSSSASLANTGTNVQLVSGTASVLQNRDHHRTTCTTCGSTTVGMTTGVASSLSNSYVGIGSVTTNVGGSSYGRHTSGTSGMNISANIGMSGSESTANSGENAQEVNGQGTTNVYMGTGSAGSTSVSEVIITSATNITRAHN